ncbi:MAG: FecR domain-containing protein [Pirellulales bacterium]
MCGGTATHADRDRLAVMLGHPAARRAAFEGLAGWLVGLIRDLPATFRKPATLSVLIAAVLLGGGLMVASVTTLAPAPSPAATDIVGRITGLHEPRWAGSGPAWGVWSPVSAGSRLELASGFAEVSLLAGGRMILEGPTVLEVLAADRVSVERGMVAARCEGKAGSHGPGAGNTIPLTIETPAVVIEDLGTEFGVGVAGDGTAEVHVFEGLVQLRPAVIAEDSVPPRLAAGDARQVSRDGRVQSATAGFARRIVRVFPGREPPEPPPEWVAEEAAVVYADRFTGSGDPAGTMPAARGGVGDVAWHAVGDNWSLAGGLRRGAAAGGLGSSVCLPLEPEPGCVYQVSVTLDVSAGGSGWGAIGFLSRRDGLFFGDIADIASGRAARVGYAWMAQRHERDPQYGGNFVAAGPGIEGKIEDVDNQFGRQRRMVQLDTRGRMWRAKFFVDEKLVAWHVFDRPPPIRFVGLGAVSGAAATFTDFRVEVWRPTSATAED